MTDYKNWSKNHQPRRKMNALKNLAKSLIVIAVIVLVCLAAGHGLDKEAERAVKIHRVGE